MITHRPSQPFIQRSLCLLIALIISTTSLTVMAEKPPTVYLGNSAKIGEVTSTSAIIWTRLTKIANYRTEGPRMKLNRRGVTVESAKPENGYNNQFPAGAKINDAFSALPGTTGQIRLTYHPEGKRSIALSSWIDINGDNDFTHQFSLPNLTPATTYNYTISGRANAEAPITATLSSSFRTAPKPTTVAPIHFIASTCQRWETRDDVRGQKIYPHMEKMAPDFFVHLGDSMYYDKTDGPWTVHLDMARFRWNRLYSQPFLRSFHSKVPSYFMKDDHDSWKNDCWPTAGQGNMGSFTWAQGRQLFLDQTPMGDKTYRTVRWGTDVQIWMIEGRDYRSPNTDPDGPEKTILGKTQYEWLTRTIAESDATFRILFSPTPILGPDHQWKERKSDNLVAKSRSHEGNRLRAFLRKQKNLFIVCGDRHWQYVSAEQGQGLREYSVGAATNNDSVPLKNDQTNPLLQYFRPQGGFLSVTVDRPNNQPEIRFRYYDIDGEILHEDIPYPLETKPSAETLKKIEATRAKPVLKNRVRQKS